jgi:heptaprenyl diphosphate synthase
MPGERRGELMRLFEQFRLRRRQVYEKLFSARALCITVLLIMPAMLFNPHTLFRIVQFFFFWFLAWLSGKKNNPLITLLIMACIIAFNLLVPYGQILFSIGIFKISSGALIMGIERAVTLEGLIMLSRAGIRQDLRIPGSFGELIGESFRIFALILDRKHRISRKNIIADIDRLMIELSGDPATAQTGPEPVSRTKLPGFIILSAAVILSWLPWILVRVIGLVR